MSVFAQSRFVYFKFEGPKHEITSFSLVVGLVLAGGPLNASKPTIRSSIHLFALLPPMTTSAFPFAKLYLSSLCSGHTTEWGSLPYKIRHNVHGEVITASNKKHSKNTEHESSKAVGQHFQIIPQTYQ